MNLLLWLRIWSGWRRTSLLTRSRNERLTNRLEEVLEENRELRIVAADFGRVKAVVGIEQVNAVIDRAKQLEQIEAGQKRAARRKHNREAR